MRVSLGVARALHYLHDSARQPLVHRDVKPHNVLLTRTAHPKLADFGLSKPLPLSLPSPLLSSMQLKQQQQQHHLHQHQQQLCQQQQWREYERVLVSSSDGELSFPSITPEDHSSRGKQAGMVLPREAVGMAPVGREVRGGGVASFFTQTVSGTRGYLDPEFVATHRASPRMDVYSFGVVLLQLVTGRQAMWWEEVRGGGEGDCREDSRLCPALTSAADENPQHGQHMCRAAGQRDDEAPVVAPPPGEAGAKGSTGVCVQHCVAIPGGTSVGEVMMPSERAVVRRRMAAVGCSMGAVVQEGKQVPQAYEVVTLPQWGRAAGPFSHKACVILNPSR